MHDLKSERFTVETGTHILVQVPQEAADRVLQAILSRDILPWGDYDQVSFTTQPGQQQFRSLPKGVNAPTDHAIKVACVELQVFTCARGANLEPILRAIYDVHPYEEPVIQLIDATRTRHNRGMDEDNPNRFWNGDPQEWVPAPHRGK
ncbi:hypothetical protein QEZ52_19335 [Aliisedimentitalea scapharcae]|uniref:Uncharacterized protein n=1 Tax=Aliisedimentitalea scapharcae TaxID=1524259 RepID=A0ABZ2XRJ4_9RHOB|nr:hypothetical protein K3727_03110 [Rhodobacteraceae bacterium M382]